MLAMTPRDERSIAEIRVLLAKLRGRALKTLCAELADDDRSGIRSLVASALQRVAAERREEARTRRMYAREDALRAAGYEVVAGLDEVGRGALAGPLTAAAVVLAPSPRILGLDDSKRLMPARREELAALVRQQAIAVSVAHISADELDALGMTAALKRVMGWALEGLALSPNHVLLDGLPLHVVENETAIVKGDGSVAAIAAASIVAKVARDALMVSFAAEHPEYGLDQNKGYGSAEHLQALARHGMSPLHRRSFTPGGGTATLF
jgi:ribonuclease HII